jgi:hypothetical protein
VCVAAPMQQANRTIRDCCADISNPQAPRFPLVRSHLPIVHRQQTSQYGMYSGLYFLSSFKSHSLRVVMEGYGVGPMGSAHSSSMILPMAISKPLTSASSVLSSSSLR